MPTRIIRDDTALRHWVTFLRAQSLPMTVSHVAGAKRSLQQNATAAMWYADIARETGEEAPAVKARCKLRHGLPIMQADNPEWVAKWSPLYGDLPYPMALKLFECIPMTRLFRSRQMRDYMEAVRMEHQEQGIQLRDPDALKYEEAL